jgi:hypothetical protein
MFRRMLELLSMANICFRFQATASRRSIQGAAASYQASRHPTAAPLAWHGPRVRFGSGSIATARSIDSNRFVTGVTWVGKELWHGTWEEEKSDLRRVDPQTGEVLELIEMPRGVGVSGLESNGGDLFFCGGGPSGMVRAVRKPKRQSKAVPVE